MNLIVTITLEDRFYDLLEELLPAIGGRVRRSVKKEIAARVEEGAEVAVSIMQEPPQQQPQTPEQPQDAAAEPRNYSMEAREIIHRTRQRIEGEDYLTNTKGEGYTKYHTALRDQFLFFAATLGVDKPGNINSPEMLDNFAQMCDDLYIADDGKLETRKAPF
ncbi:MAG: hypothetical protein Q4F07_07570 [Bacteroidales bacterium]|nr:hypothetical protein [Bacteroidales bacterium]